MTLQHVRRLVRSLVALRPRAQQRGQALVIFVLASTVLIGGAAIAADVSFLFVSQQRMQRAADAAALAGAVFLPGDPGRAYATAQAEAARNGFPNAVDGTVVQPWTDPGNPRRLMVDIDQPVGTYFARVFCVDGGLCFRTMDVGVQGRAEYVLPVPMGSPQNYYGVGQLVDSITTTTTTTVNDDTGWRAETAFLAGDWANPGNAATNNDAYTTADTDMDMQVWYAFGLIDRIPNDPSTVIDGLSVELTDISLTGGAAPSCQVGVQVTWDRTASWSPWIPSGALTTNSSDDVTVGSTTSTAAWGGHSFVRSDFADNTFGVRLLWRDSTAAAPRPEACASISSRSESTITTTRRPDQHDHRARRRSSHPTATSWRRRTSGARCRARVRRASRATPS